jgi:hypothetical protein
MVARNPSFLQDNIVIERPTDVNSRLLKNAFIPKVGMSELNAQSEPFAPVRLVHLQISQLPAASFTIISVREKSL